MAKVKIELTKHDELINERAKKYLYLSGKVELIEDDEVCNSGQFSGRSRMQSTISNMKNYKALNMGGEVVITIPSFINFIQNS
jgi:AsmA-like C-terminal region